jgi:predicted DNA-binding transcriptional regulator AlpA
MLPVWSKTMADDVSTFPPLLSLDDVASRVRRSKQWVRSKVKEGQFPKPLDFGYARPVWSERQLAAWLNAKLAEVAA